MMETVVSNQEIIKWDNKFGIFEATLWDGKITDICMCSKGSNVGGSNCLWAVTGCEEFLIEIHKCLGELIEHMGNKTDGTAQE